MTCRECNFKFCWTCMRSTSLCTNPALCSGMQTFELNHGVFGNSITAKAIAGAVVGSVVLPLAIVAGTGYAIAEGGRRSSQWFHRNTHRRQRAPVHLQQPMGNHGGSLCASTLAAGSRMVSSCLGNQDETTPAFDSFDQSSSMPAKLCHDDICNQYKRSDIIKYHMKVGKAFRMNIALRCLHSKLQQLSTDFKVFSSEEAATSLAKIHPILHSHIEYFAAHVKERVAMQGSELPCLLQECLKMLVILALKTDTGLQQPIQPHVDGGNQTYKCQFLSLVQALVIGTETAAEFADNMPFIFHEQELVQMLLLESGPRPLLYVQKLVFYRRNLTDSLLQPRRNTVVVSIVLNWFQSIKDNLEKPLQWLTSEECWLMDPPCNNPFKSTRYIYDLSVEPDHVHVMSHYCIGAIFLNYAPTCNKEKQQEQKLSSLGSGESFASTTEGLKEELESLHFHNKQDVFTAPAQFKLGKFQQKLTENELNEKTASSSQYEVHPFGRLNANLTEAVLKISPIALTCLLLYVVRPQQTARGGSSRPQKFAGRCLNMADAVAILESMLRIIHNSTFPPLLRSLAFLTVQSVLETSAKAIHAEARKNHQKEILLTQISHSSDSDNAKCASSWKQTKELAKSRESNWIAQFKIVRDLADASLAVIFHQCCLLDGTAEGSSRGNSRLCAVGKVDLLLLSSACGCFDALCSSLVADQDSAFVEEITKGDAFAFLIEAFKNSAQLRRLCEQLKAITPSFPKHLVRASKIVSGHFRYGFRSTQHLFLDWIKNFELGLRRACFGEEWFVVTGGDGRLYVSFAGEVRNELPAVYIATWELAPVPTWFRSMEWIEEAFPCLFPAYYFAGIDFILHFLLQPPHE